MWVLLEISVFKDENYNKYVIKTTKNNKGNILLQWESGINVLRKKRSFVHGWAEIRLNLIKLMDFLIKSLEFPGS